MNNSNSDQSAFVSRSANPPPATVSESQYPYDMDNPLVYRNAMGRYKTERQLAFIRGFLAHASLTVLDIGGGGGRIAIPIADQGHRVTVLDLSREALDLLRQRSGARIETIHTDLLTFQNAHPFEAALIVDTLKYFSAVPLWDVFSKVNSCLTMNGLLLIAEINKNSWRNKLSVLLGRRRQSYNIESPEGYKSALQRAGFEVVTIAGFLWMPLGFNSDSFLVRVFGYIEERLNLGNWKEQSPWLLIAARKVSEPALPCISSGGVIERSQS